MSAAFWDFFSLVIVESNKYPSLPYIAHKLVNQPASGGESQQKSAIVIE